MLFHSFAFLLLFATTFAVYWSIKNHRRRVAWLVIASIIFYANWNAPLVSLIAFSAVFDFLIARWIEASTLPVRRKVLLTVSITASLGLLAYFKYTNFLIDATCSTAHLLGIEMTRPVFQVVLPLGISFYTFETISYVVDVYRGRLKAERNFLDYALFLMFFPHLIAGPIVRPGHFLPQVKRIKYLNWYRVHLGMQLVLLGLIKKAVIADQLANLVDPVFASPGTYSSGTLWVAVLCYAVQIYCDFSGYSDMAIGTAHALGFHLPENFNMPYFALNIADFWRRWHISLSTWLRDYLYIPLGGNRHGAAKMYRNLMITMLLGGLWHGAGWTFVFWGFYHGLLLAMHRAIRWPVWLGNKRLVPLRIASTFLCVCVGWVFFRAKTFSDAWLILHRMFVPTQGLTLAPHVVMLAAAVLTLVFLAHLLTLAVNWQNLVRRTPLQLVAAGMAIGFLLVQILMPDTGGAFIYFQF
jgi:alginate O-acetyltransferase complex protein AlgI